MSIRRLAEVVCDGCGISSGRPMIAGYLALGAAHDAGWVTPTDGGTLAGLIFCPECTSSRCRWCGLEASAEELSQPDPFFTEGIVSEDELRLCSSCRQSRGDDI